MGASRDMRTATTVSNARSSTTAPAAYILLLASFFALFAWSTPTHSDPWVAFHSELAMAVGIVIAAAVVLWRAREQAQRLKGLPLVTLLLAGIPLVQWLAGLVVFAGDAAVVSMYLAGFALAQMIGERAQLVWSRVRVHELLAGVILAGSLISLWFELCQWQQLDYLGFLLVDLPSDARPFANFGQPNLLATLLAMGSLATATLLATGRIGAPVAVTLLFLLSVGLAMTQARAALLEVIVIGALLWARRRALGMLGRPSRLIAAAGVMIAALLAWQLVRAEAPQRPAARDIATLTEIGARGPHWGSMLDAIGRHPWAGSGWAQGAAAQFEVAPDHPAAPGVFDYGHQLILDLLLWNGVPLGLVVVMTIGAWFVAAISHARDATSLLALGSVAAVFTHAMVEYPLYYAYFLLPVGLLMGSLASGRPPLSKLIVPVPRVLVPALLLAIAIVLAIVSRDYLGVAADLRALDYERARIGINRPRPVQSSPVLLTQLAAYSLFARTPEHAGMSGADLQAMADVVHRYPSGPNIVRYAAALAMNNRANDAAQALGRVCKMTRQPGCEQMKSLWQALGKVTPQIARIEWPPA